MSKLNTIVKISLFSSLTLILNQFSLFQMPYGGSISLSTLPLILISLTNGWRIGMITGIVSSMLLLLFGGIIINPFQVLFDYIFPYTSLSVAGIFENRFFNSYENKIKRNKNIIFSILTSGFLFLLSTTIGGVIFWSDTFPKGQNLFIYSLLYNSSYLIPSLITVTIVLIIILSKKNIVNLIKK